MNNQLENFAAIVSKGEDFYKSLGDIYCPYFKEKVFQFASM